MLLSVGLAQAQSKGAAEAFAAGYEVYSLGDYKNAAAIYEKLLKDYPTDPIIPAAQLQLAFCFYFLGQFDQALDVLRKAESGSAMSAELKQTLDGLVPQILSGKAAAVPAADPKRNSTFEEATAKFTEYINKYPQASDLENVIFGRAIAEYQLRKFDDAVKDLELNLQKFPQSGTLAKSKHLLAVTLATQGSALLVTGDPAAKKAFGLYQRATDYLREIIRKKEDVALINEANFQLGEILLNQAAYSPESERPNLYAEALAAFRAVAPKEEIIALQQNKVREFVTRKAAFCAPTTCRSRATLIDNERELRSWPNSRANPTKRPPPSLKMAEIIFFNKAKTTKPRVVLRHVDPFLASEEDKKRALYFTTMTYALQNAADQATTGYNDFQSKYKGDMLADNLPAAMGSMYLALNNAPEALRYFNEALAIYPNGRFTGLAVVQKANAEARLGNLPDALKTFQDYLAKNPPAEIAVIAQAGVAGVHKDNRKWDDAIAAYNLVKTKYPGTPQAVEADYWIGICTQQKGDNAAAAPILDSFAKTNPQHALAPLALYAKGGALIALGKKDEGIAALASVAEQFPESQPAPFTYFMRAQLRASEGKASDVVALMREFIRNTQERQSLLRV
jgi:TolA-binding protein